MITKSIQSALLAGLVAFCGFAAAQTPATAKGDNTDAKTKPAATAAASDKTRAEVKADAKATPVAKAGEGKDVAKTEMKPEAKATKAEKKAARAKVKANVATAKKTGEGADVGKK